MLLLCILWELMIFYMGWLHPGVGRARLSLCENISHRNSVNVCVLNAKLYINPLMSQLKVNSDAELYINPLMSSGPYDCTELLLKVNSGAKLYINPLMSSGAYDCMELLRKAGANPNFSSSGKTRLIAAACREDARILKLLLKASADPDVVDFLNQGFDALQEAQASVALKSDWAKAHYREGAAYMLLNEYSKASEAFLEALKLDPNDEETKKAHREDVEAEFGIPVSENLRVMHI